MSNPTQDENKRSHREPVALTDLLKALFAWFSSLPGAAAALTEELKQQRSSVRAAERRTDSFPESDRRLVQLFLLFHGLFPMWRSLGRAWFSRHRGRGLRLGPAGRDAPARSNRLRPLAFVCVALLFSVGAVFFSMYTTGTAVSYNGETLEIVGDAAEAQKIAARVESNTAETLGSFAFGEGTIQYTAGLVQRSQLGDIDRLEQELNDEIGLVTYGYSLYIDDELIGSTEYEGALEALLDQIKQLSASEDTLSVDFVEDVRISEGYVPADSIVNLGRIAEVINSTKLGEETYTVAAGDTWGKIAMDHGMSNAELEALNPGYNIDWINIGDELILSREVPYLTVMVTERQNYVTDVDYDVTYVDDSSMYQGDTRVIEKGAYGTADVVADVVYVNGIETEREIISEVMLTEPRAETRARGTKERPSWLPTGSFRWPASGRITSGFGHRNTGIRGASTNHMGIDIACSYGSPIYAADGGTVIYTGYKGAMGYTVIIDHGNGFVTYYEHCSSFTCSAGQHVYKGQQIARVGSTGVSSGAHCHFGVQRNGSYVNPMNYLP